MAASTDPSSPVEVALGYHERTKHFPTRFARSLGYLDWDNQPDPFRRFRGARRVLLPLARSTEPDPQSPCAVEAAGALDDLYAPAGTAVRPFPLTLESVGRLFERSLAITAWKSYRGNRWALRANPSSGNLHPTEGYALVPPVPGLSAAPGLYHYRPLDHALEERGAWEMDRDVPSTLSLGSSGFLVGLTSILWREAWKYGERAFRYCQHDVGHAIAALRFAAASLGWHLTVLFEPTDADVATILGLDRAADFEEAEDEEPECLAWVGAAPPPTLEVAALVRAARCARWTGRANRLSASHVEWPVIDAVAEATRKRAAGRRHVLTPGVFPAVSPSPLRRDAATIIEQRRSAVAFDGATGLAAEAFYRILDRVLPRAGTAPFDALDTPPCVDLALLVHRVEGLDAGLYWLSRGGLSLEDLRGSLRPSFAWARVDAAPAHLPLFLLQRGDFRSFGRAICCDQEIASDGAFNLGMLAALKEPVQEEGAWMYRRLFWETGAIGQVLYLEAENAGLRGTGIGCFFDDEMHGFLGLRTRRFQSLYHFAVGKPVDDPRLQTWPAYTEGARWLAAP